MDGFGLTNLHDWLLRKGGMCGKGDLEAGRTGKFFWAVFIFKQAA
jgi:hypothetical protein